MSLFDLVINIIESSIMCYFIYKYFDFKQIEKLWLFILIDFTSINTIFQRRLLTYFRENSLMIILYGWAYPPDAVSKVPVPRRSRPLRPAPDSFSWT